MFVQVIQGHVADPNATKASFDRWAQELAPSSIGWLGSTAGVTDDGEFIALARFESADAARRNSARPEQDQWWAETSRQFDGEVTFHDSDDVVLDIVGDIDRTHFVQVMRGRGTDADRARELMSEGSDEWADFRPDILASVTALHGDGEYTTAIYFTSEEEARAGERKEPPPALKAQMDEMNAMSLGPPEFLDLRNPWMQTPE